MKTNRSFWMTAVSLIALATFVAGCGLFGAGGNGKPAGRTSQVTISIPAVSPLMEQALAAASAARALPAGAARSRALMFATQAKMIVYYYQADSIYEAEDIAAESATYDIASQLTTGQGVSRTFSLYVGFDYHVEIRVWNEVVDDTNYILKGTQDFYVEANTTSVSVGLIPQSAIALTIPTPPGFFPLTGSFDVQSSVYSGGSFTTRGGEGWFSFTAPSEVAKIVIDPDDSAVSVYASLYGPNGKCLASGLSPNFYGGDDDFATIDKGLDPGEIYYIGLVTIDSTGLQSQTGGITVTDATVEYYDQDEPNDTPAGASLYQGFDFFPTSGRAYDADWFTFTATTSGPANIWFAFNQPLWGEMRVCNLDQTTQYGDDRADWESGGKRVFLAQVNLTAGTDYYVVGDFFVKDPQYQYQRIPISDFSGYDFGAAPVDGSIAPPSYFEAPAVESVKKGQLLVNEANPSSIAYLWLSSSVGDDDLHLMRSSDGGAVWGSSSTLDSLYDPINDFAADLDVFGNVITAYIEADNADGSGDNVTSYWNRFSESDESWGNSNAIWGIQGGGTYGGTSGSPAAMFYPSVHRVGASLKVGYGYHLGGQSYGHLLTWSDASMSAFYGSELSGGDNYPYNHQVSGDGSGNTYYLYTAEDTVNALSDDVFVSAYDGSTAAEYLVADLAAGNNAAQPWLQQRSEDGDYLLLYTEIVGSDSYLMGRVSTDPTNLALADAHQIANESLVLNYSSTNPSAPKQTYFAAMDSSGTVHVVYQVNGGYFYRHEIDGTLPEDPPGGSYAGFGTLDGMALNVEYGQTVLYVSYRDESGNAHVLRINPNQMT